MINFAFGVVTGLVLVQIFPRSALVGAWIVKRGKALLTGSDGA